MKNRKKIGYIPGMYSIILLPVLSILLFQKYGSLTNHRVLEISTPIKGEKKQILEFKNSHEFKEYTFSSDDSKNDKLIAQIDTSLNRLRKSNDTLNGIHAKIGIGTKYKYFIQTINLLHKYGFRTYLVEDDDLWTVWNVPIVKTIKVQNKFYCGVKDLNQYNKKKELHLSKLKKQEEFLNNKIGELWTLPIIYLLLVVLSIKNMKHLSP